LGIDFGDDFGGPFFVFAEVLGFGLDWVANFFLIVLLVFVFEIFGAPGVFAERGLIYGLGINDDAGFEDGFEVDSFQVGRGGLQGVEEEARGFGVDLSAEDEAHDLHERDLDGVGVFEHGEIEDGASAAGAVGVKDDAGLVPAFVEVAEMVAL
jgi:hypothetical protein